MHFSKESTINDGNCIYGDREMGLGGRGLKENCTIFSIIDQVYRHYK